MAGLAEILSIIGGKKVKKMELDQEWVKLIVEARNIGIQKEEVSMFLKEQICINSLLETNNKKVD